jgi:hypothetical protein
MYFYDMGDFQIVGASPEILVRQEDTPEGGKVTIRPLAGTRPRGATPDRDKALEAKLAGRFTISQTVTAKLTCLVVPDGADLDSEKVKKAKALGIEILRCSEFIEKYLV